MMAAVLCKHSTGQRSKLAEEIQLVSKMQVRPYTRMFFWPVPGGRKGRKPC